MHYQDREALEMFADYQRAQNLAATTIRNRQSILTTLAHRAGSLVDADVFSLRRHVGREGVTAGTRRTERGAILAFFTFLATEGLRDDNPALKLPKVHAPKGEPRPFTPDQVTAMLESGAYSRTRAMILLGVYQGFRVASISAVHGLDIDHLTQTIRVVGKGGKERRLPLHPVIAALAKSMPVDGWWFPARSGSGHVHPSSVTDLITKAKRRAGITDPELTPHSLRHAFGTELVEAGVDIRVIAELMMHESVATTQIYTRVSERLRREGIEKLEARPIPLRSGRPPTDNWRHRDAA